MQNIQDSIKNTVKDLVKNLPLDPGVYRFYSGDGSLLYIGKAKNLKNRVSSYFQDSKDKSQRIRLMVSQIERVEYTVVKSDKEAILMEANLIHAQQPRYNIALKDDRSYVYVRLTNDLTPRFFLTRRKFDPKSKYFGPYTKRFAIDDVLRTLRIIFPFCQEKSPNGNPCQYVSLKQCDGICYGKESLQEYKSKIEQIKNVLEGKTEQAEKWLQDKIKVAVELNNYELAGLWRDKLRMLSNTVSDQKVVLPIPQNIDLVTLVIEQDTEGLQIGSVFVQSIREGKIINVNNFLLSGSEQDADTDKADIENKENRAIISMNKSLANSFLERFILSFNQERADRVPMHIQVFENKE